MREPRECPICDKVWQPTNDNYRNQTCSQSCGSSLRGWSREDTATLKQFYLDHPPPGPIPIKEIAARLGRNEQSVKGKAHYLGITGPKRDRMGAGRLNCLTDLNCGSCGKDFHPRHKKQQFCSHECGAKDRWTRNEHPRGMVGKLHTDTTKKAIGRKSMERWKNMSAEDRAAQTKRMKDAWGAVARAPRQSTYSRTKSGKRDDLGGLFVRSSWEANYARYLNFLQDRGEILSWQYEPQTFTFENIQRGTRHYTPDFKVVTADGEVEWHEVKGWMDQKSRTKLKRFAKYYPEETLVLIDEPVYRELEKKLGRWIKGWEFKRK